MTENTLQIIQILKLLTVVGFAALYGYGGIRGKWKRRIIGSLVLTVSIVGFSIWMNTFNWWLLLSLPCYFGALTKGYGASTLEEKWLKRSLAGFLGGIAALPVAIIHEAWLLLGFHIFLCVSTSIVLGVYNPFSKGKSTGGARAEETAIGFTYGFYPLMLI